MPVMSTWGVLKKKNYWMTTFVRTVAVSLIRVRDEDAIIFLIYHPVVVIIIITNVTCRNKQKFQSGIWLNCQTYLNINLTLSHILH